jgi:hypothetical protein
MSPPGPPRTSGAKSQRCSRTSSRPRRSRTPARGWWRSRLRARRGECGDGQDVWSRPRLSLSARSPGQSCSRPKAHGPRRESAAPTRSQGHYREPSRLPRQASRMPAPPSPALLYESPRRIRAPLVSKRPRYPRRDPRRSTVRPLPLGGLGPRKQLVGAPRHRRRNRHGHRNRSTPPRPRQRTRPRPQTSPRTRARSADSRAVVRRHI